MRTGKVAVIGLSSLFLLAACVTTPMAPTVQVLPGSNKPFQVFQQDQVLCKQYAQSQVAGQAEAANNAAVGSAALATLVGAAAGAAIGNRQGAGAGAGTGVVAGTAIGAGTSQNAQLSIQEQYNNAYVQCMYSKGNQVPGAALPVAGSVPPGTGAPPPGTAPPPPPGSAQPGVAGNAGAQGTPAPATQAFLAMTLEEAQAKLNALGYRVGRADGVMGPRTHAQLKLFQKAHGIPETGELDDDTQAALAK